MSNYKDIFKDKSTIGLKVKARAKENAIVSIIEIKGNRFLKISIKAMPIQGKANMMLVDFLAKELEIDKKKLKIIQGKTSSYKVLKLL